MWKKVDDYYWEQGNFTIATVGAGAIKHNPNIIPFSLNEKNVRIGQFKTFDEANTRYYEIMGERIAARQTPAANCLAAATSPSP